MPFPIQKWTHFTISFSIIGIGVTYLVIVEQFKLRCRNSCFLYKTSQQCVFKVLFVTNKFPNILLRDGHPNGHKFLFSLRLTGETFRRCLTSVATWPATATIFIVSTQNAEIRNQTHQRTKLWCWLLQDARALRRWRSKLGRVPVWSAEPDTQKRRSWWYGIGSGCLGSWWTLPMECWSWNRCWGLWTGLCRW